MIRIIGCGPAGTEWIPSVARQAVEAADVLAGAPRLLALFPRAGRERIEIRGALEPVFERIDEAEADGLSVAVLVSGDPGLFSLAKRLRREFGGRIAESIPAISSVQVAFAKLGLPWESARLLSAHGRIPDIDPETLHNEESVALLLGGEAAADWIGRLRSQLKDSHECYLCRNLARSDEVVRPVMDTDESVALAASSSILVFVRKDCE